MRLAYVGLLACLSACGSDSTTRRDADGGTGGPDGGGTPSVDGGGAGGPDGGGGNPNADGGVCPPDPIAPGTPACPADCTGGCNENVCVIDCSGNGAPCDGADIVCPPEYDCQIICLGVDACDSGTITCPPGFGCSVICGGGNDACGDQTITCGAGPCSVECEADACSGAVIDCGAGACTATCGGQPAPTVQCGLSCECTEC
jgi:hypothetical protein